jgi:CheY-like chemotaxis protein
MQEVGKPAVFRRRLFVPVKILVADDSATMRQIIHMTFAGEDAEIMAVDSAAAAVERARLNRPDVIFADASMNPTDGYELARAIKSDPSLANIAVIMLTSQFNTFDEARARQSGVDDHVDKPFDTQVAIDKVGEVLSRPRASVAGQTGARPAPPPPAPPRPPAGSPAQAGAKPGGHRATVAFGSGGPPQPPSIAAAPSISASPANRPLPPAMPGRQPAAAPVLEIVEDPMPLRSAQVTPVAKAPGAPQRAPVSTAQMAGMPAPPSPIGGAAARATDGNSQMADRLSELGLSRDQIEGVLALSREVIERVVWEVVPDLAETLIREEIKRLTAD